MVGIIHCRDVKNDLVVQKLELRIKIGMMSLVMQSSTLDAFLQNPFTANNILKKEGLTEFYLPIVQVLEKLELSNIPINDKNVNFRFNSDEQISKCNIVTLNGECTISVNIELLKSLWLFAIVVTSKNLEEERKDILSVIRDLENPRKQNGNFTQYNLSYKIENNEIRLYQTALSIYILHEIKHLVEAKSPYFEGKESREEEIMCDKFAIGKILDEIKHYDCQFGILIPFLHLVMCDLLSSCFSSPTDVHPNSFQRLTVALIMILRHNKKNNINQNVQIISFVTETITFLIRQCGEKLSKCCSNSKIASIAEMLPSMEKYRKLNCLFRNYNTEKMKRLVTGKTL